MKAKTLFLLVSIFVSSLFIGACGGGGSDSPEADNQSQEDSVQDSSSEQESSSEEGSPGNDSEESNENDGDSEASSELSCDSIAHGETETRVRYFSYEASTCSSETQSRSCDNGVLSDWSGSFAYESCQIVVVTDPGNPDAFTCSSYNQTTGEIINVSTVSQLEAAIGRINSEDASFTVLIADGTYNLTRGLWIDGSNFIIRSQSGNRDAVILNGQGMNGGVPNIFWFGGQNSTVADISFGNVANHAIQVRGDAGADTVLIHNVRIFDTGEQMIKGSYNDAGGADNGTVQCSLFEYTNDEGPQWYIGGVDVHNGSNWLVRNNTFKNIRSPEIGPGPSEHAVHFWSDSQNITIESNTIINCDRGIGLGLGDRGAQGGDIRNNMIYNDGQGLNNSVGIGLENASDVTVINNTVYLVDSSSNAIEYRFAGTTGTEIYNNLTNRQIRQRDGGQATVSNNVTNAAADWFLNANSGDLHLASDVETVVDQAMTIDGLTTDIDGHTRPLGNAPDIGADELVQGNPGNDNEEPGNEEPGNEEPVDEEPIENPSDLPLLDIADVTYQGGFRLSTSQYGPTEYSNLNYAPGPIAYNPENHSLFVVGHAYEQGVAEFKIPEIVNSQDPADFEIGSDVLQNFNKINNSGRVDTGIDEYFKITGLSLIDNKLVVNYMNWYDAGGQETDTTIVIDNADDLDNTSMRGPFQLEGKAHISGWLTPIPLEWQSTFGGTFMGGHAHGSIISRLSVGPTAFVVNPEETLLGNMAGGAVASEAVLDYSLANMLYDKSIYGDSYSSTTPILYNHDLQNDLWTMNSGASYGFIVPGTNTYMTVGFSAGHESGIGYKITQDNGNLCGGPCAYEADDRYNHYWLFRVTDLEKVKNGEMAPHDVRPYKYGRLDTPNAEPILGASFDPETNRLYLSLKGGDQLQQYNRPPLFLVYEINN